MHDYFSGAAGLSASTNYASSSLSAGDPLAAQLSALSTQPSHALLGAQLESLVAQSAGDAEMELAEDALDLWTTLIDLINELRSVRVALEAAVADPTNNAKADAAAPALVSLRDSILPQAKEWTDETATFLQNPDLLAYLPKSGQAADSDPKTWQWPELVTTRRTFALRQGLLKASAGTTGLAIALGAISGYATRLTVGSWRNAVVGGPPRNHPLRSRLVARTGGAWLRAHRPGLTPPISALLGQLESGVGPTLPDSLADQLTNATQAAYDAFLPSKTKPDFKKAYKSMLRHLAILDQLRFWIDAPANQVAIPVIPPPNPPPAIIQMQAAATGSGSGSSGTGTSGTGGGITIQAGSGLGGGPGGTNAKAKAYSGKSGAEWWKVLIAVLVTILLTAAGIILGLLAGGVGAGLGGAGGLALGTAFGEWIGAWENNTHDTYAHAESALSKPDAAAYCKSLFELDMTLYSAASQFLTALKVGGLAYPETPDLTVPPFKELLAVQSLEIHRAMPASESFVAYPTSGLEQATTPPNSPSWPYGFGALPGAAIEQAQTKMWQVAAAPLSMALWRRSLLGDEASIEENHNLEADRGFMMLCWRGLTQPQPVSISLLPFEAV